MKIIQIAEKIIRIKGCKAVVYPINNINIFTGNNDLANNNFNLSRKNEASNPVTELDSLSENKIDDCGHGIYDA